MSIRRKILIPSDELSINDKKTFKENAITEGIRRAMSRSIAGSPDQLIIRPPQNIADFGTALDQWNTAALNVVGTAYSVFQAIAAPALANNKVLVIWGVGVPMPINPISLLSFQQGATGGTTFAQFDLEQLDTELRPVGYLSEPIVYEPSEVIRITATARVATGLLARLVLGAYIIEPAGPNLSK